MQKSFFHTFIYMVNGANWYPVYDCRMDLKTKKLVFEYYGKIFQNTGEDWNNVNLTLSTARPDLSGQIPEINPWELDYQENLSSKKRQCQKKV